MKKFMFLIEFDNIYNNEYVKKCNMVSTMVFAVFVKLF